MLARISNYSILLICILLVYYAIKSETTHVYDLELRGDTTICTTISKAPLLRVTYNVNGQVFESKKIKTKVNSYQKGERFKLVYDRENPNTYEVLFYYPIYSKDGFDRTRSIGKINTEYFNENFIEFEYMVDEKKYSRGQKLPPHHVQLDIKQEYMVFYDKTNPKIAYLSMDKID